MPCYTTVRTTITDLALAIESAKKLRWTVEKNLERLGQDVLAAFRTPAGTLQLRQFSDGTYEAQGVARATVYRLTRTYAEEGVMKCAQSKGYFAQAEAVLWKKDDRGPGGEDRIIDLAAQGG